MTIAVRIRDYIRENFLYGSKDQISDEGSLLDAGIIDSTGAMELVSFLESEFGVQIDDQDLVPENLDSIAAMTAFVTRKTGGTQPGASALAA